MNWESVWIEDAEYAEADHSLSFGQEILIEALENWVYRQQTYPEATMALDYHSKRCVVCVNAESTTSINVNLFCPEGKRRYDRMLNIYYADRD